MERELSRDLQRLRLDAAATDAQADRGNIADEEPTAEVVGPDDGICPEAGLSVSPYCPHPPPPCRSSICYMERLLPMQFEIYQHASLSERYRNLFWYQNTRMRRARYGITQSSWERRREARRNALKRQPPPSES
ncbi:uncharacterized protein LOC142584912 [Dermacentor variabilis]|uniref:uncharacterized protein LOC142584912 n=1 Tax=Dermacentor variabilis TaxID=34621 RepID=UPI003F5BFC32